MNNTIAVILTLLYIVIVATLVIKSIILFCIPGIRHGNPADIGYHWR